MQPSMCVKKHRCLAFLFGEYCVGVPNSTTVPASQVPPCRLSRLTSFLEVSAFGDTEMKELEGASVAEAASPFLALNLCVRNEYEISWLYNKDEEMTPACFTASSVLHSLFS